MPRYQIVTGEQTQTLSNKRITRRVGTVASSATPTINIDNVDVFTITALAVAITSMSSGLSGTPTAGQYLAISFKDNGTARAITWGASYASTTTATLPTTTVVGQTLYVEFIYNTVTSTWDCIMAAPTSSGGTSSFWTLAPGTPTRTGNTTFTVTDTANANLYNLLLQRGVQIKWLEATVEKRAMIISATYASNTVTVTIIGDTMASIDSASLKYHNLPAKTIKFYYPLTTAVATDVCAPFQSDKAYRVYGAKPYLATAGVTGSSTYDINKGGTTMFTTKPTLATTVTAGADFTANNGTSLASGDLVTIDIDAISTTAGIGLTIDLYLGESQLSYQV